MLVRRVTFIQRKENT